MTFYVYYIAKHSNLCNKYWFSYSMFLYHFFADDICQSHLWQYCRESRWIGVQARWSIDSYWTGYRRSRRLVALHITWPTGNICIHTFPYIDIRYVPIYLLSSAASWRMHQLKCVAFLNSELCPQIYEYFSSRINTSCHMCIELSTKYRFGEGITQPRLGENAIIP